MSKWQRITWLGSTAAVVVFGLWGYLQLSGVTVLDATYATLALFALDLGPATTVAALPWQIEIARFLALLIVGRLLASAAAVVFRRQIEDRRLRAARGHAVVIGDDPLSNAVVSEELDRNGQRRWGPAVVQILDRGRVTMPRRGALVVEAQEGLDVALEHAQVAHSSHVFALGDIGTDNAHVVLTLARVAAGGDEETSVVADIPDPPVMRALEKRLHTAPRITAHLVEIDRALGREAARRVLESSEEGADAAQLGVVVVANARWAPYVVTELVCAQHLQNLGRWSSRPPVPLPVDLVTDSAATVAMLEARLAGHTAVLLRCSAVHELSASAVTDLHPEALIVAVDDPVQRALLAGTLEPAGPRVIVERSPQGGDASGWLASLTRAGRASTIPQTQTGSQPPWSLPSEEVLALSVVDVAHPDADGRARQLALARSALAVEPPPLAALADPRLRRDDLATLDLLDRHRDALAVERIGDSPFAKEIVDLRDQIAELQQSDADLLCLSVCGASASAADDDVVRAEELLRIALRHQRPWRCVSGGTPAGIPGAVGRAVATLDGSDVTLVGFSAIGHDSGEGYHEHHEVGSTFAITQPIAAWKWLVEQAAARGGARFRLLAFPGGRLTRAEVVLARVLGVEVGFVGGDLTVNTPGVLPLAWDAEVVNAFLDPDPPSAVKLAASIEKLARAIHEDYRARHQSDDAADQEWDGLNPGLQESNRAQARHIPLKLRRMGLQLAVDGEPLRLDSGARERLAQYEHGRWVVERLRQGWRLGPRHHASRRTPYVVGWDHHDLDDDIRAYDRDAVALLPVLLERAGLRVAPVTPIS